MNKRIIYFACHYSSSNHKWYSSGGNAKVTQTINLLKEISDDLIFVNFTPKELNKIIPNTINICSSFNKIFYSLEILFSFLSIRKLIRKKEKLLILVYNPRFTSLLFFLSSLFLFKDSSLIIQVEDIPGARKDSLQFLNKISFKILSFFSKHIFFAGKEMLKNFKEENNHVSNISLYPPFLSTDYLEKISSRKSPFQGNFVNIVYAGGYSKEKGIYDLIDVFKILNIKNYKLNIYGYFPDNIKRNYLRNKSIIFHGLVKKKELIVAYSECDIIVNPHRAILNNDYISPHKNIEIFASRALPIVSENSISKSEILEIRNLCTYKNLNELKDLIKKAPIIWAKNSKKFESSSKKFLNNYSEEKISNIFKKTIEDL